MKEIEILVEIKDTEEKVLSVLNKYENIGVKKVLDIYFYDPLRKNLQPEKDFRLKSSFRIRRKEDKSLIAYKIDNFDDKGVWIYSDEHEVVVDNFNEVLKIINHLGLKELVRIENKKHTFKTSDYEIVFENVKNLGLFLEVEKLEEVADDQVSIAKEEIRDFIDLLKINLGEELNSGKPELMLRKLGFNG